MLIMSKIPLDIGDLIPTKFPNKRLDIEEIYEMQRETYWIQSGMNFN